LELLLVVDQDRAMLLKNRKDVGGEGSTPLGKVIYGRCYGPGAPSTEVRTSKPKVSRLQVGTSHRNGMSLA
jgi:hypothetical protein